MAVDSSTKMTKSDLDNLVLKNVRMDMSVRSAKARMELFFMEYNSLLRQNGMKYVSKNKQTVVVRRVLSAIKLA